MDMPPVLEPAEHILDLMTLAVEQAVVFDRDFRFDFDGMQAEMPTQFGIGCDRLCETQPRH